ncbi:MAG: flagellar hook-basal body complex protein FliE [candidate division FCPU426 bacterium]
MSIEGINGFRPLDLTPSLPPVAPASAFPVQAPSSFTQVLTEGLAALDRQQSDLQSISQRFLEGQGPALHEIMLQAEETKLNLEFVVQLRNKVVEAYQEIMRLQV